MGFFDKVKNFAGGHGVTAKFTMIERQDPASARFPVTDSVLKFNVEVSAAKEAVILAHDFEVYVECKTPGKPRLIRVASDRHDETTKIIGGSVTWPYTIQGGETVKDGCCIIRVDVPKSLKEMGVTDPASIIGNKEYRLFVKFIADVKGSPMDTNIEQDLIASA